MYNPDAPLATPEEILYQMKVGGVVGGFIGGAANVSGVGVNSNVNTNTNSNVQTNVNTAVNTDTNINNANTAVANNADLSAEQLNVMQEMAKLKASEQSGTLSEDPNIAGMQLWLEVFRQEGIEVPEIALTNETVNDIVSESEYSVEVSSQKMHQQGAHFNRHGREMGYYTKVEYENAARDFITENINKPETEIFEGIWNGKGKLNGTTQIIIRYNGMQVIVEKGTMQILDFYIGTDLSAFINVKKKK